MSKLSRAIKYQRRQKAEKRRLRLEKKMRKCVLFSDAESDSEEPKVNTEQSPNNETNDLSEELIYAYYPSGQRVPIGFYKSKKTLRPDNWIKIQQMITNGEFKKIGDVPGSSVGIVVDQKDRIPILNGNEEQVLAV